MTKRIFRSIFLVALVVLLLSVALLSVVFYNDYAVQYRSELKSEALSMAHAINGGLAEEDYLRSLEQDKISPIRITWIGADGRSQRHRPGHDLRAGLRRADGVRQEGQERQHRGRPLSERHSFLYL